MIVIYKYLKHYLKAHFNKPLYLATVLFTALLVYFNFKYDFEDSVIDAYYGSHLRILWMFLAQSLPYYGTCLLVWCFTPQRAFLKNPEFWIISLLGFLIYGLNRGNYYSSPITSAISPDSQVKLFIYKLVSKWLPLITVLLPLALVYHFFHRQQFSHFYGLNRERVNLKPYWVLLALMVPLIAIASFQPAFLKQYPNYLQAGGAAFAKYTGVNEVVIIILHEISYAFGFFIVELFFRGFLIFGLVKYLGKEVVLPMAVTYCVLHFGKPMGEAISSFFGGYILGIIALETKNIYGGIVVHIGIALLMELFAFWQLF